MSNTKRPTVLITGSSGGIGRATAKRFADSGYQIVLHGFRHMDALTGLMESFATRDIPFMAIQADISDRAQVFSMVERVLEQFKTIDVLVNNAGIAQQN